MFIVAGQSSQNLLQFKDRYITLFKVQGMKRIPNYSSKDSIKGSS